MPSRVLVIDDDPVSARLMQLALQKRDYEVVTVSNGLEGLREVQERAPDAVVLDVMLPGVDGFEVCRRLRASNNSIPIIIISAKSRDVDMETGFRLGADEYLVKPVSPSRIADIMRTLLNRVRIDHQPASVVEG